MISGRPTRASPRLIAHRYASSWVLALSVLLCGCTFAAPSDEVGDSPAEATGTSTEFPLDAFDADEEERQLLQDAVVVLTAECMAAHGFPDYPVPTEPPVEHTTTITRHYGVTDAAAAARFGYHDPESVPLETVSTTWAGEAPEPSDAEYEALYGFRPGEGLPTSPPTAGCLGDAAQDLYGDTRALDTMASRLARQVSGDSLIDPRVMAALAEWSECMRSHGYDVVLPEQPVDDVRMSPDPTADPSPEEIEMATTDVACKDETDLIDRWKAAEIDLQNAVMADDYTSVFLKEQRDRIDDMVARAAALVGEPATTP